MSETVRQPSSDHDHVWELIPWFVTGTLDADENARVAAHLDACPVCRAEYQAQTRLAGAVAGMGALDSHRERIWSQLQCRIAAEPAVPPRGPRVRPKTRRAWLGGTALAAAAAAIALAVWPGPAPRDALYETLTDRPAAWTGPVVRVKIAPEAELARFDARLRQLDVTVLDGPSSAGVYTLGLADGSAAEAVAERLRADDGVVFVTVREPQ